MTDQDKPDSDPSKKDQRKGVMDYVHDVEHAADPVIDAAESAMQYAETQVKSAFNLTRHPEKLIDMTREFLRMEVAGGILLIIASLLALVVANSPFYGTYDYILNEVYFRIGLSDPGEYDVELKQSLLHWINDGLMAIFFLLVGLEIKREMTEGAFSSFRSALLPACAAIGGMAVPALTYMLIAGGDPTAAHGWAIPAATDIAFSLCILSLAGSRVPVSLKILLTGIAIIDDLGAILIIAFFYTGDIAYTPLAVAGVALMGLVALNRARVMALSPYILLGFIMWVAVLNSGVHATLAGVATALAIPMRSPKNPQFSPLKHLEHELHPWVAFLILPLFGFANAGVRLDGLGFDALLEPVTLGIAAGLFIGKQVGVFGIMALCILTGLCQMPARAGWLHLYAVSLLCGIGFTMSLFIGELAFYGDARQDAVRIGVIAGSVLSAALAFTILKVTQSKTMRTRTLKAGQ